MTEVLVRAEGLDVNEVPDGYVIYQTEADRVHYLNKTAAIVFELCDGARGTDGELLVIATMLVLSLASSAMLPRRGVARRGKLYRGCSLRRSVGVHSVSPATAIRPDVRKSLSSS